MPTAIRQTKEGTYQPRIKIKGKEKSKTFKTIEEAISQRKRWEEQLHYVAPVAAVAPKHIVLPFSVQNRKKTDTEKERKEKHRLANISYRNRKRAEDLEEFNKHQREIKYIWRERTGTH